GEGAEADGRDQVIADLEARRRHETEERAGRVWKFGGGQAGGGRRQAGAAQDLAPAAVRLAGGDAFQLEAVARAAKARLGHALDGEDGEGLEVRRLAEEEQVEGEVLAGGQMAG